MSHKKHYIWSAIGKFGTEILGFTGNILVARILMPEDYGLIAMVAIFISLSTTFTEAGFNDGLIRKSDADKIDFGTIATFNIVIALILYTIIFISAPFISQYFDKPELTLVTRLLSISILLKAFTMSGTVSQIKALKFKQLTIIHIISSIFSIAVTYSVALLGYGYWALVAQPIALAISNTLLLMIIAKWRPYFCFDKDRFKQIASYSIHLLLSYIINTIGANIYSFIIGSYYSTASLGFYNQANKMQTVPTQGINNVMLTTSYPIIAKENDLGKRYKMYVDLFKNFLQLQSVLVFGLISVSEFVFYVLLGEKWLPSAPLFKIFMLLSIVYPLVTININIIKLNGKSALYRNLTFLRNGLKVLALIITAKYSLETIIWGQVIAAYISATVDMCLCGKTIDLGFFKQIRLFILSIWKPFLAFSIGSIAVYLLNYDRIISSIILTSSFVVILIILYEITGDVVYKGFKKTLTNALCRKNLKN